MSKSVSLVLGCGAARGLAHIGVIQVLLDRGFTISSISGTSMGALVGGLYAAGGLEEYTDFVLAFKKTDFFKYLDLSVFGRNGMLKGDIIIDTLKNIISDVSIEDLPIPYIAVAADINSGREIWLKEGPLFDAIRASIAIPGVFTPQRIGNRLLVDGGIVNPVPVMPVSNPDSDLTIAVDVNAAEADIPPLKNGKKLKPVPDYQNKIDEFLRSMQKRFDIDMSRFDTKTNREQQLGMTDILLKSFTTMQAALTRYKLAANQPDVLVSVPRNICEVHEFHKAADIIKAGAWCAERALETAKY